MKHVIQRLLFLLPILLAFVFFKPQYLHAEIIDRIVALVNDDIITLSDLNKEGQPIFNRIREEAPTWQIEPSLKKAREDILNRLIDKLILQQRAAQYGVSVGDEELDAALNNIMASNNVTMEDFRREIAILKS